MTSDFREHLQAALRDVYTRERELGGGGMSRNLDRFKREIAVAAQLQHPHIVPLLLEGMVSIDPDLPQGHHLLGPIASTKRSLSSSRRRQYARPAPSSR